ASIGVVSYIDRDYWPLNTCLFATDFHGNNPRYVYYFLQTLDLAAHNSGSAQPSLNRNYIAPIQIRVPTRAIQDDIVALIGSLDDKIELNRQMNETLEAMAQAIFRDWFVDFGPTRRKVDGASDPVEVMGGLVTDAERAQQLADLFPERFGDNGLPGGWRIGEIGDIVSNVVERCKPSAATQALPYVPIDTIDAHKLVLSQWRPGEEAQSSLVRFKSNDILFGAMRPYFHKVAVSAFDGVTRTTVFVLRPKLQADLYFAASQINEPSSIEYATLHSSGSTIPYAVWPNSFEKLPAALPPPGVRHKYGELVTQYFSLMNLNEAQNRVLSSTRDLLLPKLMSGEIRLQEADEVLEAAQ
ncbi:restriction endonuclease subunit S, partial [Rhizobium sp.]|uniref:restriction endonuclease subunit S n=1 Tax=Rhizobium sp. TaxID=391 RepID=UPI0028A654EF